MKLKLATDFSLPAEAVTQTFAILARKRVGKTYTASVMAEEFVKASLPFVVLDPTGAWWGLRASADGKSEGYPVIVIGGAHGDVPLEEGAGKVIADLVVDHPGFYVIDLSATESNAAQDRFATDFGEHFYRRKEKNRAPMHLFVDEADSFAPQRPFPGQQRMLGAFEAIVRRGGIRGIGITLITQRPAVLNKNVLTQAEVLIALQMSAPQDQDAIEEWIRRNGSKEERDQMMGTLASLQRGEAWLWSPSWLRTFQKIHVRERTTFNSSATPEAGAKPVEPARLAPVDLAKLGERIAATVQRAKENDPGLLKRELAEVKKQLKVSNTRREELATRSRNIEPGLKERQLARVEKLTGLLRETLDGFAARLGRLPLTEAITELSGVLKAQTLPTRTLPIPSIQRRNIAIKHRTEATDATNGDVVLSGGLLEILKAAAQHPDGVTDEQISVLTGYRKTSRTTYKQKLMAAGYLARGGRGYVATGEGIVALGNDFVALPTGSALRQHWLGKLSGGELALFQQFVAAYPEPLSNEQLLELTQYQKTSVVTYKQKLTARNLIVATRPGEAKASEELFE